MEQIIELFAINILAKSPNIMLCLVLALALSFLLGLEREFANKWAGLRTHILVCVGSCVFTIISIYGFPVLLGGDANGFRDSARVAAQVLTGIGFIGGGTVLRHGSSIYGLTTASTLWMAAAIGMACGCGLYNLAIFVTILAVAILVIIRIFERLFFNKVSKAPRKIQVTVTCAVSVADEAYKQITDSFSTITEINRKKYDKDTFQSKIVFIFETREKHPIQWVTAILDEIKELNSVSIVELND